MRINKASRRGTDLLPLTGHCALSARRSRIVAVQAVAVGLLIVVAFLTLLRPEGEGPLLGVDAPQGPASGDPAPHTGDVGGVDYDPANDENGADAPGAGRRAGDEPSGSASSAPPPASASRSQAPSTLPAPPISAEPGGGSPADDQYDNTLARLAARVN